MPEVKPTDESLMEKIRAFLFARKALEDAAGTSKPKSTGGPLVQDNSYLKKQIALQEERKKKSTAIPIIPAPPPQPPVAGLQELSKPRAKKKLTIGRITQPKEE